MSNSLLNWFRMTNTDKTFDKHLLPLKGTPNLLALQLGAFCGDASRWLLENVLTHESSRLHDVDHWLGSLDIHDINFAEVEACYDEQFAPYRNRVGKFKQTSTDFFTQLPPEPIYDFIYIDGDHT